MSQEIHPCAYVHVRSDGEKLKRWDVAVVFSVERGADPILYGCYCEAKDLWEFLPATKLKP